MTIYTLKTFSSYKLKLLLLYVISPDLRTKVRMQVARILAAVNNDYSVLLEGSGGTGKTFTLIRTVEKLQDAGRMVSCTATTGVAALNLSTPIVKASTLHRWAGIGLGDKSANALFTKVKYDPRARQRWVETEILIIDEVSMLGASLFEKLDYIGRNIRGKANVPFGGLILILCADFLQLPPVNDEWVFSSQAWKCLSSRMAPIIFSEPKRYPDLDWFEMLLRIRKGEHTQADVEFLYSRKEAYDQWLERKDKLGLLDIRPTILHSKRADVESENTTELEKLPGRPTYYKATDTFLPLSPHAKIEYYEKLLDDAIPKMICLNIGAQVMLKANLDIDAGLANGSRGVVIALTPDSATVKWRNGTITIVSIYAWSKDDKEAKMVRTQIPLVLAYSVTIHKAQGVTIDYAVCNLGPSIFCPGQAYVSLSRIRESKGLLLSDFYPDSITADKQALTYVDNLERSAEGIPERFIMVFHEPEEEAKTDTIAPKLPQSLITTVNSDICNAKDEYIIQQCNCLTVKPHGLSETIQKRFPYADLYSKRRPIGTRNLAMPEDRDVPGGFKICESPGKPKIVCLFGQWRPGSLNSPYVLSYPESFPPETNSVRLQWFKTALKTFCDRVAAGNGVHTVAIPYKIGCGLAGGSWDEYEKVLKEFSVTYKSVIKMTLYNILD